MTHRSCPYEDDVVTMVREGRWPSAAADDLAGHIATCDVCAELAAMTAAIQDEASRTQPRVPNAATVWWRAQVRARQDAAREVGRPISVAQAVAFAGLVGVAGAVFGATADWFQRSLRWIAGAFADQIGNIRFPSLPLSSENLGAVVMNYWLLALVAGIGLLTMLAIAGWAMREE